MQKRKILLCWGYHRAGWRDVVAPLFPYFDCHFLFFVDKRFKIGMEPPGPVHYWLNHASARTLLAEIQPQAVVFMGIDSLHAVALNLVCKRSGVPTAFLQHGILADVESFATTLPLVMDGVDRGSLHTNEKLRLIHFFLRSLRWTDVSLVWACICWQRARRRMPEQLALARYQFPERQADRYLVHTLGQARYFFNQRDGVDSCSLVETGNPTFDSFFMNTSALPESVPYDLLVDQPLAGSSQTTARLKTIEEVKAFYRRLADFSHRRGHRLIVKLHPSNYDDRPLSDHANIEFLCDHPHPADLIRQSRAVFGFYSTLLLPAILWKPTCLFRVGQGNSLYETAEKMGVATVVDFDELPALDFDDRQRDPTALQQFEEMFLYRADGKASERLVDAVSTLCEMSANRQLAFRP